MITSQSIAESLLTAMLLLAAKTACAMTPPPMITELEMEQMPGYTPLPSGAHFGNIAVAFETTTLDQFSQSLG